MLFEILCVLVALVVLRLLERLSRWAWIDGWFTKYVLVTGCDTGFGRLTAVSLDQKGTGCHVIACCLKQESVEELQKSCSTRLLALKMDVTSDIEVQQAADAVQKHIPGGKGLYALINNAGIMGPVGPLAWLTVEQLQRATNVNVMGTHRVTNAFLPLLKSHPGSRIINTASVCGRLSLPNFVGYCMSKFGVECLSDALRRELRPFGITVHIIEPGGHRTSFLEEDIVKKLLRDSYDNLSPDMRKEYGDEYFKKLTYAATDLAINASSHDAMGVVNAYKHATFSRRPKTRYSIGADSVVYLLVSYLPSCLQDFLFSLSFVEPRPSTYNK